MYIPTNFYLTFPEVSLCLGTLSACQSFLGHITSFPHVAIYEVLVFVLNLGVEREKNTE